MPRNHGRRGPYRTASMFKPSTSGLREARIIHGHTQAKAAEALGIKLPRYQHYESGKNRPPAQTTVEGGELSRIACAIIRYLAEAKEIAAGKLAEAEAARLAPRLSRLHSMAKLLD